MEWTQGEQLILLGEAGGVGILLGVLLDVTTAWGRCCRSRKTVFVLDAGFGLAAALITFFAALAMADGVLHPLFFAGIAAGMVAQRLSLGRIGVRLLTRFFRLVRRLFSPPSSASTPFSRKRAGKSRKKSRIS